MAVSTGATDTVQAELVRRLPDSRSRRVVFLSHCLLNENTRYLGGACHGGCIPEIVQQCMNKDLGIVQMPCPEQKAWGGVLKRRMLLVYGLKQRSPLLYRLRPLLLPAVRFYTRYVYRRMARDLAKQIEDYLSSGFTVAAVVGVDGSPTCGVDRTIKLRSALPIFSTDVDVITPASLNALLRADAVPGSGIFMDELRKELRRRGVAVPVLAHDLFAELDGKPSNVLL